MACDEIQAMVTSKASSLVAQLSEKSQALQTEIKDRAEDIDPDVNTSGIDVWVGIDFDVQWERVDFSLDIPEVSIVDQKWVIDLPQVTVKNQEIVFHTPSVRMKTVKTGEYPETTCKTVTRNIGLGVKIDVPECVVTFSPIYMDVPETFMQEQRTVFGVPEFRMDRTEMILGIPEVKMTTQSFALHLPQITVKNIRAEAKKAEEEGRALSDEAKVRGAKLREEFKEEAKLSLSQDVKDLFYCFEQQLSQTKNSGLKQFEDGINLLQSTITAMVANKVPDDNESLKSTKTSLDRIIAERDTFARSIEQKIRDLHAQQQAFFEKLIGAA